jgi:hypothetical protein
MKTGPRSGYITTTPADHPVVRRARRERSSAIVVSLRPSTYAADYPPSFLLFLLAREDEEGADRHTMIGTTTTTTATTSANSTTIPTRMRNPRWTWLGVIVLTFLASIQTFRGIEQFRAGVIPTTTTTTSSSSEDSSLYIITKKRRFIPLAELTRSDYATCKGVTSNGDFKRIENTEWSEPQQIAEYERTVANTSIIPKMVHVTAKTRCAPDGLHDHINKWRLADHALYYHDDTAMDRLFYDRDWSDTFPHLTQGMHCLVSGAARADLWRALVLYEYGGIYTDMDSAPHLFNATTIDYDHDEAFFVVESLGIQSQYFMVARPRHPLMYLLVQMTLLRLYEVTDVGTQYVPFVTGPGALKNAFIHYMGQQHGDKTGMSVYEQFQKVGAGVYRGATPETNHTTVRVVGNRGNSDEYIWREALPGKGTIYQVRFLYMFAHVGVSSSTSFPLRAPATNLLTPRLLLLDC